MRAWALLALAGCGLPAPTERDVQLVRQLPPPPGPYVRVKAVADLDGERLAGSFDVLLVARTGPRPRIRLQLLPDLGGKALDLVASPDHLSGVFPATGESIEWSLPDDAKAHPLLFIAITLLERFAPVTEDRLIGAADGVWELTPVVEGASVRRTSSEWRFGWGAWVRWTARDHDVFAKGFQLKLRDVKIETLGALDEGLFRLK